MKCSSEKVRLGRERKKESERERERERESREDDKVAVIEEKDLKTEKEITIETQRSHQDIE
jgi:hypothetical protein